MQRIKCVRETVQRRFVAVMTPFTRMLRRYNGGFPLWMPAGTGRCRARNHRASWLFKRAGEIEIVSLPRRTVGIGERKLTKRVPMDPEQVELVLIGLIQFDSVNAGVI